MSGCCSRERASRDSSRAEQSGREHIVDDEEDGIRSSGGRSRPKRERSLTLTATSVLSRYKMLAGLRARPAFQGLTSWAKQSALNCRGLHFGAQKPLKFASWTPRNSYSVAASSKAHKSTRFDPRFFSSKAASSPPLPVLSPPAVGRWLLMSSGLVFAVIVVGGVTRLTESGLSITEWKPITGTIPPLTREQWTVEFEKYKGTPEFKLQVPTHYQMFRI